MKTACDIDGVICDIHSEIKNRVRSDLGIELPENYSDWNDLDEMGISNKWIYRTLFRDEWFWARAAPYEDNINRLNRWSKDGHEVHLVTGRDKDLCGMVTTAWLKRNHVDFHTLAFAPVMHKLVYLKENAIPVIIEDRFFEANRCASFGIRAYVVKRPWNEEYIDRNTNPLLRFVDDLSEIVLEDL